MRACFWSDLLRQSAYSRLAGYEDLNHAQRLSQYLSAAAFLPADESHGAFSTNRLAVR